MAVSPSGLRSSPNRPPPIVSHQGDTVVVHATNGLGTGEGTALHTHGQFFNGSSWYDGAVQTTQCPIPPGETLEYHIDTSLQTGTYW
jgi:iron transport multicopper oxidase